MGDGFPKFMKAKPFVVICGGRASERESVAAALLKRTFAYNFTNFGWTRALFNDAFQLLESVRDAEDAAEIMARRTLVLLELQNVEANRRQKLNSIMRSRNDTGKFTILTIPSLIDVQNLHSYLAELIADNAQVISLGG
jgi:hypothetical protein